MHAETNFNLISIQESTLGEEIVQTVNARELHQFLEVGRDFSNWIKDRVEKYNFVANQDFIVLAGIGENSEGRPRVEYHISLDMAKELSMVERNAKGKQARQYFIAIEKAYREQHALPKTFAEALQLAADQAKRIEQQSQQIAVMQPKAEYYDDVMGSEAVFDGEQTAKMMRMSRNKLYDFLRSYGVLTKSNMPMQMYIDKDYMRVQQTPYRDVFGNVKVSLKVVFTQQGIQYIRMMLRQVMVDPKLLALLA